MRERSPGCWELRVFVGQDPVSGKLRYVSRTLRGGKRAMSSELAKLVALCRLSSRRAISSMHISTATQAPPPLSPNTVPPLRPLVSRLPIAE
jgi:hypothetical protein